jgi:hypothetical protein
VLANGIFLPYYRVSIIIWNLKTISYIEGFSMLFQRIILAVAIPGASAGPPQISERTVASFP